MEYICCGKKMRHTKLGYYECIICGKQIEDEYGLIKKTLKDYPNSNALELAKLTNLPSSTIIKYLDNISEFKEESKPILESIKPKWHTNNWRKNHF